MDICTLLYKHVQSSKTKYETLKYNRLCGLVVSTTDSRADSYTCSRWFESYLENIFSSSFISIFSFVLVLYDHVNTFSVMLGRFPVFLG